MQRPPDTEPLGSRLLQELYGEGYFHGANSGFAREGYAHVHATWRHWMPWVRQEVGGSARWLDLGCAYGFLVEEARRAGFRAVGLDASGFALSQAREHAGEAAGRVLQGHAESLPFADDVFDVVSAFDLLEHVPRPERLLAEAARVLRPGGLLLAATPDPIVFDRYEPTHVAERVPSWWVCELERLGFGVTHRFFQADYNCELVARLDGEPPSVSFDSFEPEAVVCVRAGDRLRLVPRTGVGRLEDDGCRVLEDGATFHFLNTSNAPQEVELTIQLCDPVAITVSLDGRVMVVGSGDGVEIHATFLVPIGGHRLRLGIAAGWARLLRMEASGNPVPHEQLCLTLPFDLYERYALAKEVLRRVGADHGRVLDVGGTMGGDGGHLAWTGDFLPDYEVVVIDARPADVPRHQAVAVDGALPFVDREFPVVMSQDVLEHVPKEARSAWLEEVWRITGRFLLLGCPWNTPGVAEADRYLFDLIRRDHGYEHGFLAEHLAHGHPDLDHTKAFFEGQGASVAVLPSGHLPTWILLQSVNAWLSHPTQDQDYAQANEAFNRALSKKPSATPAYRHLVVIDREGRDHTELLADLASGGTSDMAAVRAAIFGLTGARGERIDEDES